jgi:hypothetical protein
MNFIVLALPRSRTAWLSRYLTYADWTCSHEELLHARSLDDLKSWFSMSNRGTCETAAAPFWRTIEQLAPDTKIVVVRRPVDDVVDSLMKTGVAYDPMVLTKIMSRLDHKLDQIEYRLKNVFSCTFDSLENEDTCAKLFEHCLPYRHDCAWWQFLSKQNIQIDLRAMTQYYLAYKPQLDKLTQIVKWKTLAHMAREAAVEQDDLIIKEEGFACFEEAVQAMEEHSIVSDETAEGYKTKNLKLWKDLAEAGALQIVTARCNGKIFGYLATVIGPSLESPTKKTAVNTVFYGSPLFPGIGMKIQKVARDLLKEKGVNEVIYRAGVRASGAKVGILYKRLGAQPHGQLYRLEL